jgi:hypothetical protein
MNEKYDAQKILSELDDLMQIARAIEKSSRPLSHIEISK